jgi:DNA topoisomerase-1
MSQNKAPKSYLVIVESPAKCKTISNFLKSLPDKYEVIATYGHIRGLPKRNGSVLPEKDFTMLWERKANSKKHIDSIINHSRKLEKSNGCIILATDADREGEAIAWHVSEILKEEGVNCETRRIVFQEITKKSILKALESMMSLNENKVQSYFSRLSLDYLVGFGLSPILWSKVRGCKSAGRVQSAALRAIVDREFEIVKFVPKKYWDLSCKVEISGNVYYADLCSWDDKPITKFMWTYESALEAKPKLAEDEYKIVEVENKEQSQAPQAPFTTSTLQQEASQKLGWKPSMTMQIAQKLYEGVDMKGEMVGMITYMRTDSMRIEEETLQNINELIKDEYGERYAHRREYVKKTAKAQDAHEAVRPTNFDFSPQKTREYLAEDMQKLYQLIWNRTLASQMSNAEYQVRNIIIGGKYGKWKIHFRERKFDGFLKLIANEENPANIPEIQNGEPAKCFEIKVNEHTTVPPGRFTEANLIKHLDEAGIGRPSTYVSIIDTLQKREYIEKSGKQLLPMIRGWIVIGFLKLSCTDYVQDDFTARIEADLDKISGGEIFWRQVLEDFWKQFNPLLKSLRDLDPKGIAANISDLYQDYFFKDKERKCTICNKGQRICCITSNGVFIGCSNYPECKSQESLKGGDAPSSDGGIGIDPDTQENILLKRGPYGHYLHWANSRTNVSLPEKMVKDINLEMALKLKSLPKVIGKHSYSDQDVKLHVGQYGPYLSHNGVYASCSVENFWDITLEEAMKILGSGAVKNKKNAKSKKVSNKT